MRGPVGGLLLTGGASRRMGTPKALLPVAGSTLGQHLADLLSTVAAPILEVGPGLTTLDSVADDEPGAGPLAAIATGWDALTPRPEAVIVLACDLPRLSRAFLVRLAAAAGDGAVVPEVDGRLQPLCARYPAAMLDLAKSLVRDGVRPMHELLATGAFTVLPAGRWAEALADVDTPEDLERVGLPGPGANAAQP